MNKIIWIRQIPNSKNKNHHIINNNDSFIQTVSYVVSRFPVDGMFTFTRLAALTLLSGINIALLSRFYVLIAL